MNRLWVRLAVAYSFIFMVLIIVLSGLLKDQSALNATLLAEVDYSAEEAQAVRLLIDSGKLEELFEKRDIEGFGAFTLSVLMAALMMQQSSSACQAQAKRRFQLMPAGP